MVWRTKMENFYERTFDGAVFSEEKLKYFFTQTLLGVENNFHAWLNENLAKGNFKIISRIEYTRKLINDYNRIK